jgi:hypothetical protein
MLVTFKSLEQLNLVCRYSTYTHLSFQKERFFSNKNLLKSKSVPIITVGTGFALQFLKIFFPFSKSKFQVKTLDSHYSGQRRVYITISSTNMCKLV